MEAHDLFDRTTIWEMMFAKFFQSAVQTYSSLTIVELTIILIVDLTPYM